MKTYQINLYVERGDHELELDVFGSVSPFIPARTSGLPENCYPSEGGAVEIEKVLFKGQVWDGELSDDEVERAEQSLFDAVADDDSDYDYDYGEDD